MKIEIVSVNNHGDQFNEFVELRVTEDCDLGAYVLVHSKYTSETKVSNKVWHSLWFPNAPGSKGQIVIVYTRPGVPCVVTNADGSMAVYLYWNLSEPIWNNKVDCAVLLEISKSQFFRP